MAEAEPKKKFPIVALLGNLLVLVVAAVFTVNFPPPCDAFTPEPCGPDPVALGLVGLFGLLRISIVVAKPRLPETRQIRVALVAGRAAANAMVAAAVVLTFLAATAANAQEVCLRGESVCFTARGFVAAGALVVGALSFGYGMLRREGVARTRMVLDDQEEKRIPMRDLVLPLLGLLGVAVVAAIVLGPNPERRLILFGVLSLVGIRALARVVHYVKKPENFFPVVTGVARGAGWAALALFAVFQYLPFAPGMPLTAWYAAGFILSWAVLRQHQTLVKGPGLPILVLLLGTMALGAWSGFQAIRYLTAPFTTFPVIGTFIAQYIGKAVFLAAVGWGVYCVRVLLVYSGQDEAGKGADWMEWLRANFWRNLVLLILIASYLFFRSDLASAMGPMFPAVEFTLGMAVLGMVVSRVRTRIRAGLTETPLAAEWKRHEQKIEAIPAPEFDRTVEVVEAFLSSGSRKEDYARLWEDIASPEAKARVLQPVREFKDERRFPVLPYPATIAAFLVAGLGIFFALQAFNRTLTDSAGVEIANLTPIGIVLVGVAIWFAWRPAVREESLAGVLAGAGLGLVVAATGFWMWAEGRTPILMLAGIVLGIGALLPAVSAVRLRKRLGSGNLEREDEDRADRARQGAVRHTKLLVAYAVTGFLITFPADVLLNILAQQGALSPAFLDVYARIRGPFLFFVAGMAGASLSLLIGYLATRPLVRKEDTTNKERRNALHLQMLKGVE